MRQILTASLLLLFAAGCKKNDIADSPADVPPGFHLRYIEVEEHLFGGYLHLYGNFGDSTAGSKVKVGNTVISGTSTGEGFLLEWKPWYIKVEIGDPDDDTGGGNISVINNGKESNKRMVNIWELDMLYREPDEGTILKELRIQGFIRADVDPVAGTRFMPKRNSFASETIAYWAIGGSGQSSYSGGGVTISLENREGFINWKKPYTDNAGLPENFQSEMTYEDRGFTISGLRVHENKATRRSYLPHESTVPHILDYTFRADIVPLNESFRLELDGNNAIKAGTFVTGPHGTQLGFIWDAAEAPNHKYHHTLQWAKMEPRFK
ncbi:MAG TPA: hypothetical protein VGN63_09335 [Flavisolibacter sp.]|jgi:hypothetical protein|nr:hypothetical protein [Flavisolibacter sp.]